MKRVVDGKCALSPGGIEELIPWLSSPILVVGSGTGLIPGDLARRGYDVVAIDACAEMVELAKDQSSRRSTNYTVLQADVRDMDFPRESFGTVILNSGVITQSTIRQSWIEVALKKSREVLIPKGKIIIGYCLETEENCPYREIYETLHLNRVPSKNTLFMGKGTLEDTQQHFLNEGTIDEQAIGDLFNRHSGIISQHQTMIRSVEAELHRLNVEPHAFIASYLAFEKPYLSPEEQSYLTNQVSQLFQHVSSHLLSDGETAITTGTR